MQGPSVTALYKKIIPLLDVRDHSLTLIQSRIELIHTRVRLTALILALLMVTWIPIDIGFMSWSGVQATVLARLAAAAALVWLIFYKPHSLSPFLVKRLLAFLLAVPMVFFCYANAELRNVVWSEHNLFYKGAYAHFPILISMLLSLFPLTAVEGILLGGSITVVTILAASIAGMPAHILLHDGTIWIQLVVTALAVIAGMSQLHFMAGFVEYSTRDEMTGCIKRDYGMILLKALFAASERKKNPCCIFFIDLDHFKDVNDTFGHHAGDGVLKEAARQIRSALRRQDIIVRWGGEEFVVILPGTSMQDVDPVLQRFKREGLGILPDGRIQTASIGVAEYLEDVLKTADELVELADRRMYAAKQGGRNAVVMKSGSFPLTSPDNLKKQSVV